MDCIYTRPFWPFCPLKALYKFSHLQSYPHTGTEAPSQDAAHSSGEKERSTSTDAASGPLLRIQPLAQGHGESQGMLGPQKTLSK